MINEARSGHVGYISYEYRQIIVPKEHVSICMDSYPCFGWEPDPNHESQLDSGRITSIGVGHNTAGTIQLFFRRDRNISNKAELTRLQRNFDSCVAELTALERAKTTQATVAALVVGLLGTVFMGGSTFAVVAQPPVLWLTILLAIPGFAGWIAPYFLYRTLVRKRAAEIEPLMEQKYDEIHEICEKGSVLQH